MKKVFSKFLGFLGIASLVTVTASAAPLAAPDTTDLIGTIVAYGGAAVALWLAYILYPIAIRLLKGLFK